MTVAASSVAARAHACVSKTERFTICSASVDLLEVEGARTYRLAITERMALVSHGLWEPATRVRFETGKQYLRQLYLDYAIGRDRYHLGKPEPGAGFHWTEGPGGYGGALAAIGYAAAERLGLSARTSYGAGRLGNHTLRGAAFTIDETPLSQAWIARMAQPDPPEPAVRDHLPLSLVLALDGSALPDISGLRYHLAVLRHGPRMRDERPELGVDAALSYDIPLWEVSLTPVVEHSRFANLGRVDERRAAFTTGAVQVRWRRWRVTASYTIGSIVGPNGDRRPSRTWSVDSAVRLAEGLDLSGSWNRRRANGEATDSGRVNITYRMRY